MAVRVIPRSESGLSDWKREPEAMKLPARELWLHHTVTGVSASPYSDWRDVQKVAFSRKFIDISYNFGLHPALDDPLEGRLIQHVGAHTDGRNSIAFGVALIGNYEERVPNDRQIRAFRWLRHHLVTRGVLTPDHRIGYHAMIKATACPGRNARAIFDRFKAPWTAPTRRRGMYMIRTTQGHIYLVDNHITHVATWDVVNSATAQGVPLVNVDDKTLQALIKAKGEPVYGG